MNIYVLTSTKYAKLLGEFATRFEEFWGQPFFAYVSRTDLHHWSDGVIDFLTKIPDEYFVLLHEDFYLTKPVDKHGLEKLWNMRHGYDRISLLGNHTPVRTERRGEFYIHKPSAEYQFSFEASIQSKEFLLKYLRPKQDPWESERNMARVARGNVISSEHPVIWYEDKSRRLTLL
jgi:hypothetical protein